MAYITQRPEEERQSALGGGGAIAGGGGQGMSGAPAPQAGVSKGTGGTQPWVNIQNYLRANPNDQSATGLIRKNFEEPLNSARTAQENKLKESQGLLDKSKAEANQALGDVSSNINTARDAFAKSIWDYNPNIYGAATQRALDASQKQFNPPTVSPVAPPTELKSQFSQLNDPYGYASQLYAKQGLTGGQRALQEQLTRKSSAIPKLTQALSGQFNQLQSAADEGNRAINENLSDSASNYAQKFGQAQTDAQNFQQRQNQLMKALSNPSEWGELGDLYNKNISGEAGFQSPVFNGVNNITDIAKNLGSRQDPWGRYRPQDVGPIFKRSLQALLGKYGF